MRGDAHDPGADRVRPLRLGNARESSERSGSFSLDPSRCASSLGHADTGGHGEQRRGKQTRSRGGLGKLGSPWWRASPRRASRSSASTSTRRRSGDRRRPPARVRARARRAARREPDADQRDDRRRGGGRGGRHDVRRRRDAERGRRRLLPPLRPAGVRGDRPRRCARRRIPPGRAHEHRHARRDRQRGAAALEEASGKRCRRGLRALLQPRVHRPRQRHPRLPQSRLPARRGVRRAGGRDARGPSTRAPSRTAHLSRA